MDDGKSGSDDTVGKDGSLDVIWKDSPMEKKLQSNGSTSRHANATELRGFVHSLITSPSPNKHDASKFKMKRNIDPESIETNTTGISRHIMFSPDKSEDDTQRKDAPRSVLTRTPPTHRSKRKKTEKEHDDLMSVLEKLDGEYSETPEKANYAKDASYETPFSKESWEAIEQMEVEATQQSIQRQNEVKKTHHISPVGEILKQPPHPSSLDYLRCVALEIQVDSFQRSQFVRALDDSSDETLSITLKGDWFDSPILVGDAFHYIFTSEARSLTADNENNMIVLHPDILVSPTTVTSSMSCSRRAVLQQTLSMNRSSGSKALVGTMKHQLFQHALSSGFHSLDYLKEQSKFIIQSNLMKMLECGLSHETVNEEFRLSFESMFNWLSKARNQGIAVKGESQILYRLKAVLSIEEPLWSIKYGLKGAVDACIDMLPVNQSKQNGGFVDSEFKTMALELKTGKLANSIEHVGQVLLYTLLLDERYKGSAQGLLLYLKDTESILFEPVAAHLRGLLHSRNVHASHLSKMQTSQILPALLKKTWDCENCFVSSECMLHHAAVERGSSLSSGVPELFEKITSHLSSREIKYFKKWIQLLDWESRANHNQTWLLPHKSSLSGLKVHSEGPEFMEFISSKAGVFMEIKVNERVIISVESLSHSIFHVAKASVSDVQSKYIRVSLFSPVPSSILNGKSIVGSQFLWRIDKDKMSSGFLSAKRNVLSLMLNSSMDKNRKLICHLQSPRFGTSTLNFRLRQREHETGHLCGSILEDISKLNPDQQQAIEQMLNAKDYALILGMPGQSVLVTSYTHAAVDNILMKLLVHDIPILRVGGAPDIIQQSILPHRLESRTFDTVDDMREAMTQAPLVGCTCLSTHHVIFSQRRFDVCIVDEASQITQPVLLGALQHANVFCLVGDHYQLPPLVIDTQAKTGGLDWSLFKCLSEAHPQASTMLGYQYRMNRQIMYLANRLIYNNQLKCGLTFEAGSNLQHTKPLKQAVWISEAFSSSKGVVFLNTDSMGFFEEKTSNGIINPVEADIILRLSQLLCHQDVAILSPFRSQVNYLRSFETKHEVTI
ncbi:Aste57867_11282 [Aphanomyces stellatus]|uniref:DNA replication ATP-dependent helicase/nuclease n=1 Tax=Aphanomyces stellatus TaxID=120398 RepID=A0A485KUE4_9STRA|nr:hypothetical protein As57867_011240 [Aphanomyces stellatus]VFT88144.1 Aste57867_11282 [Aphanomyces stellatus]